MKKWKLWELKLQNTSTSLFQYVSIKTDHRDWIKYDVGAEEEGNQEMDHRQSLLIYSFIQQKFLRIQYMYTLFWAMKILANTNIKEIPCLPSWSLHSSDEM